MEAKPGFLHLIFDLGITKCTFLEEVGLAPLEYVDYPKYPLSHGV